ncbi:hypothetical protein B1C78_03625 [Thioalkalivibrio denitrificans]|uniref:Uncharacterized protein n=1 Tax=Thioalkalivibrio denitrificans TaxID=108003 RepID=A0A1V3NR95_9GAMM|nr:hypothetical protein [Thioalkalivibrio denitrificans]OOG27570.1 hypothetical protein B1C78_03625 [Thioalkalivibrio denitrificans]
MAAKKIGEGKAAQFTYEVYELSGEVQSETTRSETEVTGQIHGGGGPYSYVQGRIKSKTTRYQTIMLREDDGTEHAIELVNMVLPCTAGQRVTLWRLGGGVWFRGVNRNTQQTVARSDLGKVLFAWIPAILAGIGTFLVLLTMNTADDTIDWLGFTVFMAVGGYGVGWVVGTVMGSKRKSAIHAVAAQRDGG